MCGTRVTPSGPKLQRHAGWIFFMTSVAPVFVRKITHFVEITVSAPTVYLYSVILECWHGLAIF